MRFARSIPEYANALRWRSIAYKYCTQLCTYCMLQQLALTFARSCGATLNAHQHRSRGHLKSHNPSRWFHYRTIDGMMYNFHWLETLFRIVPNECQCYHNIQFIGKKKWRPWFIKNCAYCLINEIIIFWRSVEQIHRWSMTNLYDVRCADI